MSDIVEPAGNSLEVSLSKVIELQEAEIERLRKENKFTKAADHATLLTRIAELEAQIESLEAAIEHTWVPQVEMLEADNGKLRSLLDTWLNHPHNIPLRTRTKAALNPMPADETPPTDCEGEGCGECEVCKYLDFLEYAHAVAPPGEATIERDQRMEAYLKEQSDDT